MNLFELQRLRQEGKEVNLPGGRCALDVALDLEFEASDKRIDHWIADTRARTEQQELEDKHNQTPPVLLGC